MVSIVTAVIEIKRIATNVGGGRRAMNYIISEEKLNQLESIHAQIKLIRQLASSVTNKSIGIDAYAFTGTLCSLEEQLNTAICDLPKL